MRKTGVILSLLVSLIMAGGLCAQTIVCDGTICGGTGVVSSGGTRDYVYRITSGVLPADPDTVFIGTHDGDLAHYSNVCLPAGWSYGILTEQRPDFHSPTLHNRVSPGPSGNCEFTFIFYNDGGVQLSSTPTDFGFNHSGGYPHDVDWMAIAYQGGAAADWNANVGQGAGPIHGPRCDTLCQYGTVYGYTYMAGIHDDFSTADGPEPSSPDGPLLTVMGNTSGGSNPFFDSNTQDRCFGHTFSGWDGSCCIVGATLCFKITANATNNGNDIVLLREDAVNTAWLQRLSYLKSFLSGVASDTILTANDTIDICLDLAHMPVRVPNSSQVNFVDILGTLQDGDLDFLLQDDSKIDFLDLTVRTCEDCDPDPDAACCLGDGTCILTGQSACNQLGGIWLYPLQSCTPHPCDSSCVRPPNNMLAWWPLDETVTNKAHDIADGHIGDNTAGGTVDFVPGKVDGAYRFNWDNYGIVRAAHDPFEQIGAGDFTIDAWINPEPHVGDCLGHDTDVWCFDRFILSNELTWRGVWFFLRENPPGATSIRLRTFLGSNTSPIFTSGPVPITLNNWHHVAVTVSRTTGGGQFYYNGLPVGAPFTIPAGALFDPARTSIDIGHGDPVATGNDTYKNRYFGGLIDEVEIFDRALDPTEIEGIFLAGEKGKCKQYCNLPRVVTFCPNETDKTVTLTIFNEMDRNADYTWSVYGPSADCPPGITGNSPSTIYFSPSYGGVVSVSANSVGTASIKINRPASFGVGDVSCYTVCVRETATGRVFCCDGSIKGVSNWYCPVDPYMGPPYAIFQKWPKSASTAQFTLENTGDASGVLDYEIKVESSCSCDDTEVDGIISLNGLAPGSTVTGSINIPIGDTGTISVNVELLEYRPFTNMEIVLRADSDNDGEVDDVMSIGYHPMSFPDCNGNGIDDAEDINSGGSLDNNNNDIPDECEPNSNYCKCGDANSDGGNNVGDAVFLINYVFKGGSAPDPIAAGDANFDCGTNVGDAVYIINYVFKGGDPPICDDMCEWPD